MKSMQPGGKRFKPQRGQSKNVKAGKAPSLKNQIRGMERLLRKPNLDPKMRARQEVKLQELRAAQAEHQRKELERKYAVRYHKVRFFERVKLERRLQRLQAQLTAAQAPEGAAGSTGMPVAQLQQQVEAVHEDLQYVQLFPKAEKYVSLLRQADDPVAQEKLDAERARLRALVKRQLAEAAMLAEADEGAALAQGAAAASGTRQAANQAQQVAVPESEEEQDDFFLGSEDEKEEEQGEAAAAAPAAVGRKRQLEEPAEDEAGSSGDVGVSSSGNEVGSGSSEEDEEAGQAKGKGAALAAHIGQGQQQLGAKQQQRGGKPWQPKEGGKPWKQQQGGKVWQQKEDKQQGGGGRAPQGPRKPAPKVEPEGPKQPLRLRAEGGRKRRRK